MRLTAPILLLLLLCGCVRFNETYHFAGVDPRTQEEQNHYRVTVRGKAAFSKARYVSGHYDERALDLFFNEIKSASKPEDIPKIFEDDIKLPGTDEKLVPLGGEDGTFLMIFSTNAKAVADTIGQFAENQVAADAVTNLLNQSEVQRMRDRQARIYGSLTGRSTAVAAELTSLFGSLPSGGTPDATATSETALRILNAIAAELGATRSFASMDEVSEWLDGRSAGRGGR